MEQSSQLGRNRTGIDMSPRDSKQMISNAEQLTHPGPGNSHQLKEMERDCIREAEAVGSVPMPGTLKGSFKSAMEKVKGRHPETFVNKLGERLAYERSGVRLYDAFITKCEAAKDPSPVSLERARHFRAEEAEHFTMLEEALKSLGADPTAQTPDADVTAVASMGVMKVMSDPRTTVPQCVSALLVAELTDHAGWELLVKLAGEMGMDEMADRFRKALLEEQDHLDEVRGWCERATLAQV